MIDDRMSAASRVKAAETPESIRTLPVSEIVAAKLRDAILSGQLKPGERLIEQKWAARFGIGQPTLREAFRELELQGFLVRSRQRGTYVTKLSLEECSKVLEVRMALESVAIQRATACMTPEALAKIAEELHRLEAAARDLDLVRFHDADMAFHKRIWEIPQNEHLSGMLEQVAFRLFAFLKMRPAIRIEYGAAVEQHRQIFEGLRSGDPAAALESFTKSTLKFWKEEGVEIDTLIFRNFA